MAKKPVIITIDYTDILLPDDKGVATILSALSNGVIGHFREGFGARPSTFEVRRVVSPTLRYPGKFTVKRDDDLSADEAQEATEAVIRIAGSLGSKPLQLPFRKGGTK